MVVIVYKNVLHPLWAVSQSLTEVLVETFLNQHEKLVEICFCWWGDFISLGGGQKLGGKEESLHQRAIRSLLINEYPMGWSKMPERKMQAKGTESGEADPILRPVTCKSKSRHSVLHVQLLVLGSILCPFKASSAVIFMAFALSSPPQLQLLSGILA